MYGTNRSHPRTQLQSRYGRHEGCSGAKPESPSYSEQGSDGAAHESICKGTVTPAQSQASHPSLVPTLSMRSSDIPLAGLSNAEPASVAVSDTKIVLDLPPVATSSNTPIATGSLLIEVKVFHSDLEHPQSARKYEIEPANSCVEVLIWMVTLSTHPGGRLTPLRDHTRWYLREMGRHSHTTSGLEFRRLVPEQSLRDIPLENGLRTVCVVQSDKPYLVLAMGREESASAAGGGSDRGVLIKDYLDLPLAGALIQPTPWGSHVACEYRNRLVHATHSITADNTLTWRDLPREQVQDYSADWLVVLPSGVAE
ncbi:hypothetical protein FRB95_014784 [Tulasnella sp. JGI-2019a]|nr:hypothetical protein FRB95_014784 [Tulasnella sp. JGI-2019a]